MTDLTTIQSMSRPQLESAFTQREAECDRWRMIAATIVVGLIIVVIAFSSGCRFPGVDQHEGHNYEPNPWHVPVVTNNTANL